MDNQNQSLYMEEKAIGNAFRDEQKSELQSLIEQLRKESVTKRRLNSQLDTSSLAVYERGAALLREQVKDMLGWPLCEEASNDSDSPSSFDLVPEAKVTFVAEDILGRIYRVEVAAGYGLTTYGILFLPHQAGPHPLVISQHGGGGTPELCSGFYGDNNYNDMTRRVLKQGVAVFAPQLYLWNPDQLGPEFNRHQHDNELKQLGSSITAIDIYKIQRAIDYLTSRKDIDRTKVGMIGLSYGGFYTLFTAALDSRIKAAYSSCFINNRFVVDWTDFTWFNSGNRFLDAEICALIAPRFLYLEVGKQDEAFLYEHAQPEIDKVSALYQELNSGQQFCANAFDGGHELDPSNEGIEMFCNALDR